MRSAHMVGAKRVVAIGASSSVGVRTDDRPAGVAHAVARLLRTGGDVSVCGTPVRPLPNRDWAEPVIGVQRCPKCEELTA
ncbi:MAG: hypothetical protein JWQ45_393 [Blastococcus sp.]|jgi:hypothetical protein|nr:hypothetical protein [Blastococcus sp.]